MLARSMMKTHKKHTDTGAWLLARTDDTLITDKKWENSPNQTSPDVKNRPRRAKAVQPEHVRENTANTAEFIFVPVTFFAATQKN